MRQLDRYIIRSILGATALALSVLVVLMALFLYVNEQGWVGVGRYGNLQAAVHVLMMLPATLLPFLPVAALFGALLAMGQLARDGEITVMRASGVPVLRIGIAVLAAGLLLAPLALAVGEWVAPPLARLARETRAIERDGALSLTSQGVWLREQGRILRADAGGFTIFELADDARLVAATHAASARSDGKAGWQLEHTDETRLGVDATAATHADARRIELAAGADFFSVAARDPDEMSMSELSRAIDRAAGTGLDTRPHRFALWAGIGRLLALPLAMLLAVPLVLGWLRGAESARRATVGLAAGLAWYIGQRMVESGALAFDLSPPLMALLPTLLLAALVLLLLVRMPRVSTG
jgi:lipopolysaccharide export system permease protein